MFDSLQPIGFWLAEMSKVEMKKTVKIVKKNLGHKYFLMLEIATKKLIFHAGAWVEALIAVDTVISVTNVTTQGNTTVELRAGNNIVSDTAYLVVQKLHDLPTP